MSNILIAGEDLRFTPAKDPDIFPLTGEVIARLAGAEDVKDYIVIQWLQDGQLETLRADEKAHSDGGSDQRFIVFRGSTIYLFEIDGRRLTWGAPRIRGDVLKKLIGVDPPNTVFGKKAAKAKISPLIATNSLISDRMVSKSFSPPGRRVPRGEIDESPSASLPKVPAGQAV